MAGQPVKGSPAIHLVLCYLLAILSLYLETILNYIPYSPAPVPGLSLDWLDIFPIIFAHFILLITLAVLAGLWELSQQFDQIGYLVKPIPNMLSMRMLLLIECGITLVLRLGCMFLFQTPIL